MESRDGRPQPELLVHDTEKPDDNIGKHVADRGEFGAIRIVPVTSSTTPIKPNQRL